MRALYGRHYGARLQAVAAQVPRGSSVLELCCGPGVLYERHLRHIVSSYIGIDINEGFVSALRRRGVDARKLDLTDSGQPLPRADVVIMQASLYHFLPDARPMLRRMLAAANHVVIIAEPIRNLATSSNKIVRRLARITVNPGAGQYDRRFTDATLREAISGCEIVSTFLMEGGRERVIVLDPAGLAHP
jgi:trans-aconitate methyltransferase